MRNIQSKILLMFFVTGIIIILGMGAFSMNIVSQSSTLANTVDGSSFQEIQAMQEVQMKQIKILILSAILAIKSLPGSPKHSSWGFLRP
jgi:CHASE3 domain sensor protein